MAFQIINIGQPFVINNTPPVITARRNKCSVQKMIKDMSYSALLCLMLAIQSCVPAPEQGEAGTGSLTLSEGYQFPYQLSSPEQAISLPAELNEISGLSLYAEEQEIAAVQDEKGLIFFLDRATGQVLRKEAFWKDGDYEGIEAVGDTLYVVKSSGTIYKVALKADGGAPEVEKYNFFLNSDNDVEGLGYDPAGNRLLLACKAEAGYGDKKYPGKKAIYAFNLETASLSEAPVYFVAADSIRQYLEADPAIRKLETLVEFFDPEVDFDFSPSAIAVHPRTGNLYITSSVGKMLLVLHPSGRILHIEKLSKTIHPQPEGLCFDKSGTLFLSNEGKGGQGKIYRFAYQP